MEVIVPMEEDFPLTKVSPLTMDNCFLPLSNIDGAEDAWRIAVVALPLVVSLPLTFAQWLYVSHFHTILMKIDREVGWLELILLHDLGSIIPKKPWAQVSWEESYRLQLFSRRVAYAPT